MLPKVTKRLVKGQIGGTATVFVCGMLAACTGAIGEPGEPRGSVSAGCVEDAASPSGAELFAQSCATCHGASGVGGSVFPDSIQGFEPIAATVRTGPGVMPAFSEFSDAEVQRIQNYLLCVGQLACDPVNASCTDDDGCCPTACDSGSDNDCLPLCGDGVVDANELCDGDCPSSCDDGKSCTTDTMIGLASTCDASCGHADVTSCSDGDGCCAVGCSAGNDSDCPAICGDNFVDVEEVCDGNCPSTCEDGNACTVDSLSGSAANCDASCDYAIIMGCNGNDGCCPAGCNASNDNDCSATCGDGVVDANETCDGSCPSTCDDGNACTTDTLIGSASQCTAACTYNAINLCADGDGCCPVGCTAGNDNDCTAVCGNDYVDIGELCDGNCPSSCNDGNSCTADTLTGSSANCDASCSFPTIDTCSNDDGCCPAGCNIASDNNCNPVCGDGVCSPEENCVSCSQDCGSCQTGVEVFAAQCAVCHGEEGEGTSAAYPIQNPVAGYATYVIRTGRPGIGFPEQMPQFSLQQVSDQQLQELLAWLSDRSDPTTGEGLFNRYCANCHGSDAAGGVVDQDIRGETFDNVLDAGRNGFGGQDYAVRDMYMPGRSAQELSDAELQLITSYLQSLP